THSAAACGNAMPDGVGLLGRSDSLAATVVGTTAAFQPAVAFHPTENASQRRSLDTHSLGQIGLSQLSFKCQPIQHFPLADRDPLPSEFRLESTTDRVGCRREPISDAILVVVFEHNA